MQKSVMHFNWLPKPVLRGFQRCCPACGKGQLFSGYLKLNETCPECGETFSHERAADGPAWLTVLVLGPIFAPLIFVTSLKAPLPIWVTFPMLGGAMFATTLTLLAFMKGGWIGALWHMDQKKTP